MYLHFHRHQRGLMHFSQLLSYLKDAYAERSHVSPLAVCAYPFYIHISNVYFTFWPHVRWKDPVHLYESICYVRIGWNERILLSTRILLYLVGFFCVLARLRISISIFTYMYVYFYIYVLRISILLPLFFIFILLKKYLFKKILQAGHWNGSVFIDIWDLYETVSRSFNVMNNEYYYSIIQLRMYCSSSFQLLQFLHMRHQNCLDEHGCWIP